MHTDNYITKSLELHLFFGRIMKEHSLFLRAGFTPVDASFAQKAEFFKNEFEKLLCRAVALGGGIVGRKILCSGEIVTDFTLLAETQTEAFTGIAIDQELTKRELNLRSGCFRENITPELKCQVRNLNQKALELLSGLIALKEQILSGVLCCKMFTMNYPLLIEHILQEAKLYRDFIASLEQDGSLSDQSMQETERFWNQIMMEHALFIRGLLDPTEAELIRSADGFAESFSELLNACQCAQRQTMPASSLEQTLKFRDFKIAGTKGIEQCEIRSLILPLLADHVLREANHYIRLLKD